MREFLRFMHHASRFLASFILLVGMVTAVTACNTEPNPEIAAQQHWQSPSMLQFLRLAGENPDHLAIALHEYSYLVDEIGDIYPYKIGRFHELFRIADTNGIPRPTILLTEWGWTYEHVPEPEPALADIAIETQRLIDPVRVYTLTKYFVIPLPPDQQPINPEQHQP